MILALIVGAAGLWLLGAFVIWLARQKLAEAKLLLQKAEHAWDVAKRESESERRESVIKLKDELHRRRIDFESDVRREKTELERLQNKVHTRVEALEQRENSIEESKRELANKERALLRSSDQIRTTEQRLKVLFDDLTNKLENIGGMTREEARATLLQTMESEARRTHERWLQKIEEDTRQTAKEKAIAIIVASMQRYTSEQVAPHSSGVVQLPNEEMKGRIIGKEGRNIKSLEMATGMEFVIGDSPESITISGFNPIRREVARRSLEKLIIDGRINPTRIEETVAQCEREIDEMIEEQGHNTVREFNIQGLNPEIVTLLGKLYFRTSYSQNVLSHSIEVALFARMLAEELGLPHPDIALRGGLLHDIGKAMSAEFEGPHALLGAEVARRCGEDPIVINSIAAHHEEVPLTSIYSHLVMIADTISASRPGARRETLSAYVKRLEKLEELAHAFVGVKRAYALQAGREVRVIVEEDQIDDDRALTMARDLARSIETNMAFPGQIKVHVIREKRAIEYAR